MNENPLLPTRVFTMPSLPPAAARTLELLQHPHVEPSKIARVIESDPAWALQLLQLAGSSLWGRTGSPSNLPTAMGHLGLRRFYQLVAMAAVAPVLRREVPGYGLGEGVLWRHSMAVALATREILFERGLQPSEEAFTAAMVHDVGKVVLGSALETMPEPDALEESTEEESEIQATGMDHAEAGGLLLEHWKMPYWLVTAVRTHHVPDENSYLIADLVHLADALCLSAGLGAGRDGLRIRVRRDVSDRWNLSRRSLERILGRTIEVLEEATDLLAVGEGR
jgi:HD-like signal output (HDOD) protein